MARLTSDPLLAIARILILILMGFACLAGLATLIGIPGVFVFSQDILAELAREAVTVHDYLIPALAGALAIICAAAVLAFLFLLRLLRLVDSVGNGDPFTPQNADRLSQMGIIAIVLQPLGIALALLGAWVGTELDGNEVDWQIGFDGLLIGLLLLILARVFRKGTQMRDDLEGTV